MTHKQLFTAQLLKLSNLTCFFTISIYLTCNDHPIPLKLNVLAVFWAFNFKAFLTIISSDYKKPLSEKAFDAM